MWGIILSSKVYLGAHCHNGEHVTKGEVCLEPLPWKSTDSISQRLCELWQSEATRGGDELYEKPMMLLMTLTVF